MATPTLCQIGAVTIDVCTSASWSYESEFTKHPVEAGAPVTDFAIDKPLTLSIEALFSDTPINRNAAIRAQAAIGNVSDGTITRSEGAAKAQRDRLDLYRKNKTVVRVVTATKVHDSMVVESISEPRDSDTGGSVVLSIQLVEIVFAETKIVEIVKGKDPPNKKKTKGTSVPDATGITSEKAQAAIDSAKSKAAIANAERSANLAKAKWERKRALAEAANGR